MAEKIQWTGEVVSAQPRIRLLRSFDQRQHSYLGYVLIVKAEAQLKIGIGKAAQAKHRFRVGDQVRGKSHEVPDQRKEIADLFKTSALELVDRPEPRESKPPPWHGAPPDLEVYRQRGHRRLAARTFETRCASCIWGCRMPVEMIVDPWNPSQKRYRFETFCYGPLACPSYRPGPTRKVPGRRGMSFEEEDWIDEEATAHRGPWD